MDRGAGDRAGERGGDGGWRAAFVKEATSHLWWRFLPSAPHAHLRKRRLSRIPPTREAGVEVRLVILGSPGVGKSCLTVQFCQNLFLDVWESNIEDSYRKRVMIDGTARLLDIFDTAGYEEYRSMREQWMRGGHALLLLYSATLFSSFRACQQFVEEIMAARGNPRHLPLILVETKVDMRDEREVPVAAGPAAAEALGCFFARVSNKTREGVDEVMHAAARLALATTTGLMDDLLLTEEDKKKKEKQPHNKKCLLS